MMSPTEKIILRKLRSQFVWFMKCPDGNLPADSLSVFILAMAAYTTYVYFPRYAIHVIKSIGWS